MQLYTIVDPNPFVFSVNPGNNTIERTSDLSSVTIPFERTFRNLEAGRPTDPNQQDAFNFCGCGWPQHMLIPRGSETGFSAEIFVMISNFDGDRVITVN